MKPRILFLQNENVDRNYLLEKVKDTGSDFVFCRFRCHSKLHDAERDTATTLVKERLLSKACSA